MKKKVMPLVYLPEGILDKGITGTLYGYYISNTNRFNVVGTSAIWNGHTLEKVVEVFSKKPESLDLFFHNNQDYHIVGFIEANELIFIDRDGDTCLKEIYLMQMDIFSRNQGILETSFMLNSGVVISGCGSVGSLVALELARSGVGRFLLVDNDYFGYHNICRHQCAIQDVGKLKVDAVKERILSINPNAEVVTCSSILQDVSVKVLTDFCDLNVIIIGCADNREGDLYANQVAKEASIPFMSIGFWERAFAGEIFYCLPSGMPDYSDFISALGGLSGKAAVNRRFYTNEEDLARASFEPGISVDINFVTLIAIKLALDLLNKNNLEYTPRLSHLTQFTLVCNTNNPKFGGDNADLFSYPLQVTTSIEVPYASS